MTFFSLFVSLLSSPFYRYKVGCFIEWRFWPSCGSKWIKKICRPKFEEKSSLSPLEKKIAIFARLLQKIDKNRKVGIGDKKLLRRLRTLIFCERLLNIKVKIKNKKNLKIGRFLRCHILNFRISTAIYSIFDKFQGQNYYSVKDMKFLMFKKKVCEKIFTPKKVLTGKLSKVSEFEL